MTKIPAVMARMNKMRETMDFVPQAESDAWDVEQEDEHRMMDKTTARAKELITGGGHPPKQIELSFFATDMARTSPFFPMGPKEKRELPMLRGMKWETAWGSMAITGEKLSIYDETILLTLLQMAQKTGSESFLTTQHAICKAMGVNPCTNTYTAIWESIQRLSGTRLDLEVNHNGKPELDMTGSMIAWAGRDKPTGKIDILINKYFITMFAESFVTGIDMALRAKLSGDVTKALYRFLQSQRPFYQGGKYTIDLLKLAVAVNLPVDNIKLFKLRDRVRKGLTELRKHEYISRWQVDKNDKVTVWGKTKKRLK